MADTAASHVLPKHDLVGTIRAWWGDHPFAQLVLIGSLGLILAILITNVLSSMHRLGMEPSLGYLWQPANFDITGSLIPYAAGDTYGRAILVGLLNTLNLALCGCVLATIFGVLLGVARLSGNLLLSRVVQGYVELVRGTPLTLQLFFWIATTHALPSIRQALHPLPSTFLSIRGIFLPGLRIDGGSLWPLVLVLAGLVIAVRGLVRRLEHPLPWFGSLGLTGIFVAVVLAWIRFSGISIAVDPPVLRGFNIAGGISMTPEFAAMLIGLTAYYAASISESVRSGIQSVSIGQWEAGRAIGLSSGRIMRLIVLPQAMRVITPLMTSSYLDLTKDTTLGILIGFTEVTAVIKTSANNTGNAVETIIVLVVVFLSVSLPVSFLINLYNRRLAKRGIIAK